MHFYIRFIFIFHLLRSNYEIVLGLLWEHLPTAGWRTIFHNFCLANNETENLGQKRMEKKNYKFANLCGAGSSLDTNQHNNKCGGKKDVINRCLPACRFPSIRPQLHKVIVPTLALITSCFASHWASIVFPAAPDRKT